MPENILNCILFFDGLLHSINLAYSNVKLVPFPVCIHAPSASPTLRKIKPTCHVEVFGPKVHMCTLPYWPLLPSNQNHAHFLWCLWCLGVICIIYLDILVLFTYKRHTHLSCFSQNKEKNRCKANPSNVIVSIYWLNYWLTGRFRQTLFHSNFPMV